MQGLDMSLYKVNRTSKVIPGGQGHQGLQYPLTGTTTLP